MGQAFRRASGSVRRADLDPSSSSHLKNVGDRRPPAVPVDKVGVSKTRDDIGSGSSEGAPRFNSENVLEERDPQYDAMLSQMVGRIRSKSGGRLEMGEALVGGRYNRPMPKLRNTKPESGRYEEKPAPSGTLNAAQLRHILLLHQGKADDHDGPMNVEQIAEKFRIDATMVQSILQFLSLPPEDSTKQKNNRQ